MATSTIKGPDPVTTSTPSVIWNSSVDTSKTHTVTMARRGNMVKVDIEWSFTSSAGSAWASVTPIQSGLPAPATNMPLITKTYDTSFSGYLPTFGVNSNGGVGAYVRESSLAGKTITLTGIYFI